VGGLELRPRDHVRDPDPRTSTPRRRRHPVTRRPHQAVRPAAEVPIDSGARVPAATRRPARAHPRHQG
jgi:hypothetical protein